MLVDLAYRKEIEPLLGSNLNPGNTCRFKVFAFNIVVDSLGFVEYVYFVPGANVSAQ